MIKKSEKELVGVMAFQKTGEKNLIKKKSK